MGYLPPSRDLWEKEQTENRLKYAKLKEELLLNPVRCCSPSCRNDSNLAADWFQRNQLVSVDSLLVNGYFLLIKILNLDSQKSQGKQMEL